MLLQEMYNYKNRTESIDLMSSQRPSNSSSAEQQSAISIQQQQQYAVQAIRSHKIVQGKSFYMVKWLGYQQAENTWEPLENLKNVRKLVDEYMERRKQLRKDMKIEDESWKDKEAQKDRQQRDEKTKKKTKTTKTLTKGANKRSQRSESSDKDKGSNNLSGDQRRGVKDTERKTKKIQKNRDGGNQNKNSQRRARKEDGKQSKPSSKKLLKLKDTQSQTIQLQEPTSTIVSNKQTSKMSRFYMQSSSSASSLSQQCSPSPLLPPTSQYTTQFPEPQSNLSVGHINHFVIKKNSIFYEVQYVKKRPVNLLSSSTLQMENPKLIVEFYERNIRAIMDNASRNE